MLQQIYSQHLDTVEYSEAQDNSFSFNTFYYKGVNPLGTCPDWKGYYESSLLLPFDYVYFSKLNAVVQRFDYATGESEAYNVTCSDRNIISNILDSLKTGDSYESICGGQSWRVFTCSGSRVLCLNCKLNCGRLS